MKKFFNNLSGRDLRFLKTGIVAVVLIILFVIGTDWIEHWSGVRASLTRAKKQLQSINLSDEKHAGLLSVVPVFEMPEPAEKQQFLFVDKLKEQFKKAGVKTKPLKVVLPGKSRKKTGYKLLRVKCSSKKCNFSQILDLLAGLKQNPYLAGIEEFKFKKADKKKANEFELDLTVTTFIK